MRHMARMDFILFPVAMCFPLDQEVDGPEKRVSSPFTKHLHLLTYSHVGLKASWCGSAVSTSVSGQRSRMCEQLLTEKKVS